jgi:hypothetical protein
VKASTATYAVSNSTTLGSFVELAKGVATGQPPNVNKLRELTEAEISQWKGQ